MSPSVTHIIGAVVTALIILLGLYTVLRNITLFLVNGLRGHPGVAWYNQPYLFRAVAVTATLFWLFGPFAGAHDALHLPTNTQRFITFALYAVAAAAGLWVLRIGFLRSIPPAMLPLRTNKKGIMNWSTLAATSYLIQLACAVAVGLLFAYAPGGSQSWPVRVLVFVILLGSAFTSLWRMSYVATAEHPLIAAHIVSVPPDQANEPAAPGATVPVASATPLPEATGERAPADAGA